MEIQQIKYFLALAKELHFWNTAAKMNITQSALSRQIQSLENELGFQLLYRNKRNVELTPAGEFLREKWETEIEQFTSYQELAKQIHMGELGTIRIAHPDSISSTFLPDFLKKIRSVYPRLKIHLMQLAFEHEEQFLKNYKIDIAFTRDTFESSTISSVKINQENLCFVVAENHHLLNLDDILNSDMQQQELILTTYDYGSSYHSVIQNVFTTYSLNPESAVQCEFGSTVLALVKNNLGISILPESYKHHQHQSIRFIPIPFSIELFAMWRKDDPNPIIKNLLRLL